MRTLLKTTQGDRLEALFALAITTGLRQGELFGLSWENVHLTAGRLSVRQTLTTPKGGRRLGPPTRNKSRRSVKLTSGVVKVLKAHRERQLEEREKLAELWQDHDFVFTTQVGTPLNRHNFFRRCFKPLLEGSGSAPFRSLSRSPSYLRNAPAFEERESQDSPGTLGHANISQTMDTYSHMLPDMQKSAASAMDDILP